MFEKVLIANRGRDRAPRRARLPRARRDSRSPSTRRPTPTRRSCGFADEAVHIGPPAPRRSYLTTSRASSRRRCKTGADAIHPGYGFLSEDPDFAEICADEGITFIGPPPEVMAALGDKATARALMQKAGLPLLPGPSSPSTRSTRRASRRRDRLPGDHQGGRGRRRARDERRARATTTSRGVYQTTRATAQAVFSDSAVYVERYLRRRGTPRSRCSATRTATASTSASGTARCSGGTRS